MKSIAFRISFPLLLCAFPMPATAQASLTVTDFFDDTKIQDIYVTVDPTTWATLRQNYEDDTYYQASFLWNGLGGTVGIRSRGNGSRSGLKPNLDVNIDKYVKKQTFLGLDFFVLKANNQDASTIHERLAFKLFEKMGLPAPREAPARLFINNEYFGYYNIVEHEEEDYLDRNLGESGGYLYEWQPEAIYNFEYLGSDPSLYAPFLELKTDQDDPDLAWFVSMVTAINQSSDADFLSSVSAYINPRLYLTHAAIENVLGEVDGIVGGVLGMNNFYLYRFAGSNLSQFLVWDKDLSFLDPTRDIFDGTQTNVLTKRLLAIPDYRNVYLNALQKAANQFGSTNGWADQEITSEYNVVRPIATNDPNKQCIVNGSPTPCTAQDFEDAITAMHAFVAQRSALVLQEIAQAGFGTAPAQPTISGAGISGSDGVSRIAPGGLVNVATNLSFTASQAAGTLARGSGDSFIALNGIRAPVAALATGQITIQVPWDMQTGPASLVASNAGALGNTFAVQIVPLAPAIFGIVHGSGATVTPSQPAVAGEVLSLFCTGLGATGQYFDPGVFAPTNALYSTQAAVSLSIGSTSAPVLFAGLAPGFAGLYQVNFTVPSGLSTGSDPMTFSVGDQMLNMTIAIR